MASKPAPKGRAMGRLMNSEAETPPRNVAVELAELAKTIGAKADATTVFGSPIVDGEKTVIPVAQSRFGLGWGDGIIAKGLGGGMTARPLGFIVIDKSGVRFHRTPPPSLAPLAIGVVLGLALAIRLTRPRARAGG
jgi:Sporulation protein YtfJ (Spore_YtfJ)